MDNRLELTNGEPVLIVVEPNNTVIYYTPYAGTTIELYEDTPWRHED